MVRVLLSRFLPIPATWEGQAESVIFTLRLPRILAALLVGSALSLSGAAYQGVFKNPLVAPTCWAFRLAPVWVPRLES